MASLRKLHLLHEQRAAALRTIPLPVRERLQQPLGTRERGHRKDLVSETARFGDRLCQRLSPRRLVQPIVVDIPLVARPDVLQNPQQEHGGWQRQRLLLTIAIVSIRQGHLLPIVLVDAPLRQRRAARVAAAGSRRPPAPSIDGPY